MHIINIIHSYESIREPVKTSSDGYIKIYPASHDNKGDNNIMALIN